LLGNGGLADVVLTGMGSSYHALHPIMLELVESGIRTQMVETSELIHFRQKLLSPKTLLVAVSQSGRSVEILRLLEFVRGRLPLIAITNTSESPLADQADTTLLTHAGSEHSVSCKTYVSALAALEVLGELLTRREPASAFSALRLCADAMEQYLSRWDSLLASASQMMQGIRFLMIAGRGASLAAAGTGGLIAKEAAHFPAEGMSCAALRHGPLELASANVFALVYEGVGPTQKLNANLVKDIQKRGGRAELVVSDPEHPGVCSLPSVPPRCLPLLEILPAEIISIALSVLKNHIPGSFERAEKITVVE
jgi:glucosamine--fructose-6-phosphate aminotransferase (isomerizing)